MRRYGLLALLLSLPLSQLGHLVAYLLRYGPHALSHEILGTHAYFPSVARTSAGALGLVVLAAISVVGLARLLRCGRSPGRGRPQAALWELVAMLLPLQFAIFIVQETAELTLAGQLHGLGDVPLVWGLAGQAPVACLAALFLRWASVAVGETIAGLRLWLDRVATAAPLLVLVTGRPLPAFRRLASADGSSAHPRRGPPRAAHRPRLHS